MHRVNRRGKFTPNWSGALAVDKRIDGVKGGFRQGSPDIGIETAEGFAQLPVGGMDELHAALHSVHCRGRTHRSLTSNANRSPSVREGRGRECLRGFTNGRFRRDRTFPTQGAKDRIVPKSVNRYATTA